MGSLSHLSFLSVQLVSVPTEDRVEGVVHCAVWVVYAWLGDALHFDWLSIRT